MIQKIKYNKETKSFGFFGSLLSVIGELARNKHIAIVLADPVNHVIFELHQSGSIGMRLADTVQEMQTKMGLKFTIAKKFILDPGYPDQIKQYNAFRAEMYKWFG